MQDIWPVPSTQTFISAFESNGIQQSACGNIPEADFYANNLTPGIGETVNFTDLSTNSPFSWSWTISPSSVTYVGGTSSSSQNPQVQFNSDGYYTVELTATNADGNDTETKSNYIQVYGPTVADFDVDNQLPGIGQTVNFSDLSSYDPTSWSWSFNPSTVTFVGGTSATSQNPEVQFNEPGYYTVELTATNAYGTDTETKPDYINVSLYCNASGNFNFMYIGNVQIGSIDNSSGQSYYANYTNLSTDITQGQTSVEISVDNGNSYGSDDLGIWIDWNQNGNFYDEGENIVCDINNGGEGTFLFDVPEDAIPGTTRMRIRIKFSGSDCGDPCGTATYGEVEDYSLNVLEAIYPPVANFEADNTTPEIDQTINFTDLSTNDPDTWLWSFDPSTVTYVGGTNSGSQSPQVKFDDPGYYSVELTSSNAGGDDTDTKYDYIYVADPEINLNVSVFLEGPFNGINMNATLNSILPFTQPFDIEPWYYSGPEYATPIPDTNIVDWVLVELRDAISVGQAISTTEIARQAAFLRNDGTIVSIDGNPALNFISTISDNLYVVIYHRNHIPVISNTSPIQIGNIYTYNFTDGEDRAFGGINGHTEIAPGIWGMRAGNGNADNTIDINDKNTVWTNEVASKGYFYGDFNLDSQVDNKDKNDNWQPNNGKGSQVPE